jgi:hypothetical protein
MISSQFLQGTSLIIYLIGRSKVQKVTDCDQVEGQVGWWDHLQNGLNELQQDRMFLTDSLVQSIHLLEELALVLAITESTQSTEIYWIHYLHPRR